MNAPSINQSPLKQIVICTLIGFTIFLALLSSEPFNQIMDDAYISLIYARNLAAGNGLVYQGGEPVEGYSNFLWTVLCASYYFIPGSIFLWMRLTSLFMALLLFLLIVSMLRRERITSLPLMLLPLILLSLDKGFIIYMKSGMETPLHALLIVLAIAIYPDAAKSPLRSFILGLSLALLATVRPEGIIFLSAFVINDLFFRKREELSSPLWRWTTTVLIALFLLWRYLYYGDLLPNTFYAKVDLSAAAQKTMGFRYLAWYILASPPPPILILAVGAAVTQWRKSATVRLSALACVLQVVFIVVSGGDFFPWFRFFVPIAPLLYVLATIGIATVCSMFDNRPRFKYGILTALVLVSIMSTPVVKDGGVARFFAEWIPDIPRRMDSLIYPDLSQPKRTIGIWLKNTYPSTTIIATDQAGQIPYYSGMTTVDLCGLNNRHIARNGASAAYLNEKNVRLIVMEILPRTKEPILTHLIRERGFQENYRMMKIIRGKNNSWGSLIFILWEKSNTAARNTAYTKDIRAMIRILSFKKDGTIEL